MREGETAERLRHRLKTIPAGEGPGRDATGATAQGCAAAAERLAVPAVLPAPILMPAPPVVVSLVPVVVPVILRVVRVPVVGIVLSLRRRGPGAEAQRCGRDESGGHQSAAGTACLD